MTGGVRGLLLVHVLLRETLSTTIRYRINFEGKRKDVWVEEESLSMDDMLSSPGGDPCFCVSCRLSSMCKVLFALCVCPLSFSFSFSLGY